MQELHQWMEQAEEAAAAAGPVVLVSSSYSNRSSPRGNNKPDRDNASGEEERGLGRGMDIEGLMSG
jgi:hypothetical protein